MKTPEYWAERFAKLEQTQNANASKYVKRITKEYDKAIRSLNADISYWYNRYAKENGVTYTEAKRLLNSKELEAFRMDVKEYIEKGESLDPKWRKQLEQASAKVHVSRLEALKLQLQQEAERVAGEFDSTFGTFGRNIYIEQYYKTAFEIQKGLRLGWEVSRLNRTLIDKVIRKPWTVDGRNFSERVWNNRSKLVNELHTNLTQAIIRGDSPDKTISTLSKRMNVSKYAAGRLIMTESAFFSSAAQKDVFNALEVEKYEILATLDSRTSETCRNMDGKVFNRSDYQIGVTAPPFHVYCRTTTVPYFEDDEVGKRAARNPEGKYYTVPEDMTYREWEKTFVEGGSKEGLEPVTPETALLVINEASNLFKNYGSEHYQAMHMALLENGDEDLTRVWAQNEAELVVNSTNYKKGAHFSSSEGGIKIDLEKDVKGSYWSKPYQTSFHELGHNLDYILGGKDKYTYYSTLYKDGLFAKTIREEISNRMNEINERIKKGFKAAEDKGQYLFEQGVITESSIKYFQNETRYKKRWGQRVFYNELMKIEPVKRSALSDIIEGVTEGAIQAGFGHGKAYWKKRPSGVEREAFAEFWESVVNPEQWEVLKEYLPKSTAIFKEMIKEAIK